MLTRPQQILLKRAQAAAGLDDTEYRDALQTVTAIPGCRSSKDPRLTDEHLDKLMSWFEAIYWSIPVVCRQHSEIFRTEKFWSTRNRRDQNSRDRYHTAQLGQQIAEAETKLLDQGRTPAYLEAILHRVNHAPQAYLAALNRTLKSRQA